MKQRNVRMIETNGVTLKVLVQGEGPLLLLLHGFPQCGYLWHNQIDDSVAAGYLSQAEDDCGEAGHQASVHHAEHVQPRHQRGRVAINHPHLAAQRVSRCDR